MLPVKLYTNGLPEFLLDCKKVELAEALPPILNGLPLNEPKSTDCAQVIVLKASKQNASNENFKEK